MQVTATEAKNRFGQMLDAAQAGPVVIEKSGRRHSVLLSMREYEALRRGSSSDEDADIRNSADPGKAFYAKYKDWVDSQNKDFDEHGLWCEGLVEWQTGSADTALAAEQRRAA
jgi:prevent-host-death family protein